MLIGRISVNLLPVSAELKKLGLDPGGDVQKFHTANARRRIQKYMPYRTGTTIKMMIAQSPVSEPYIRVVGPHVRYVYFGKAMEGKPPKKVADRDLHYTTTKNPQAGPLWDRRLMAAEGDAMRSDLQRYVKTRGH